MRPKTRQNTKTMGQDQAIYRVVDANFNRCKEGLRVVEDLLRFVFEDDMSRQQIRKLRHDLNVLAQKIIIPFAIEMRDSESDQGRELDSLECGRQTVNDLLYCNLQRAKESARVLEECSKLIAVEHVPMIKELRYQLYALEKKLLAGKEYNTGIASKKRSYENV